MKTSSILKSVEKASFASSGTFKPQLTSLVDVMVILLVFLIKSFSSEVITITPNPDIKLPVSSSTDPAPAMMSIQITHDKLLAEGAELVPLSKIEKSKSLDIPRLAFWLKKHMPLLEDKDQHKIMIQSDKDIEFNIVKRVMYTCSKAGFSDFTILVLNNE